MISACEKKHESAASQGLGQDGNMMVTQTAFQDMDIQGALAAAKGTFFSNHNEHIQHIWKKSLYILTLFHFRELPVDEHRYFMLPSNSNDLNGLNLPLSL